MPFQEYFISKLDKEELQNFCNFKKKLENFLSDDFQSILKIQCLKQARAFQKEYYQRSLAHQTKVRQQKKKSLQKRLVVIECLDDAQKKRDQIRKQNIKILTNKISKKFNTYANDTFKIKINFKIKEDFLKIIFVVIEKTKIIQQSLLDSTKYLILNKKQQFNTLDLEILRKDKIIEMKLQQGKSRAIADQQEIEQWEHRILEFQKRTNQEIKKRENNNRVIAKRISKISESNKKIEQAIQKAKLKNKSLLDQLEKINPEKVKAKIIEAFKKTQADRKKIRIFVKKIHQRMNLD